MEQENLAEKYWLESTEPVYKMNGRHFAQNEESRKRNGAMAWIDFKNSNAILKKIERLPSSPPGAGKILLKFILEMCDKYNLTLSGNILPYHPYEDKDQDPTIEDYEKIQKWYESLNVLVRRDKSIFHILYAKSYDKFFEKMPMDSIISFIATLPNPLPGIHLNILLSLRNRLAEIAEI